MKKLMVSCPMRGKSDEQIQAYMQKAAAWAAENGYEMVDTLFTDADFAEFTARLGCVPCNPVVFLSMSICVMSTCDAVYFCDGWEDARGCVVEHRVAEAYGITIIEDTKIAGR